MASAIQWFNENQEPAEVQCEFYRRSCGLQRCESNVPSDRRWLRHTQATVEALRIFPFLDNDVTIGSLVIELPQYIASAATQDVVIQREGKKVEWWRVYEEWRPK